MKAVRTRNLASLALAAVLTIAITGISHAGDMTVDNLTVMTNAVIRQKMAIGTNAIGPSTLTVNGNMLVQSNLTVLGGGNVVTNGQIVGTASQSLDFVAWKNGYNVYAGDQAAAGASGMDAVAVGPAAAMGASGNGWSSLGFLSGWQATGDNWTALGSDSGEGVGGTNWTAVGYLSGMQAHGNGWSALGYFSADFASGDNWSAIGVTAGYNAKGNDWIALGRAAGANAKGDRWNALGYLSGTEAIGTNNTYIGSWAGRSARGDNRMYFDTFTNDPGVAHDPMTESIVIDGKSNGVVYVGRPNGEVRLRGNVIGNASSATVSGTASQSMDFVTWTNSVAVKLGQGSTNNGMESVALGAGSSVANNTFATAVGNNTYAGTASVAIGKLASAGAGGGQQSLAVGLLAIGGDRAVALGSGSSSTGAYAAALGTFSRAQGPASLALGAYAIANGTNSVQMGIGSNGVDSSIQHLSWQLFTNGVLSQTALPSTVLTNNHPGPVYMGTTQVSNLWVRGPATVDSSLVVGVATSSPAMVANNTGLGIGTSPYYTLHLKKPSPEIVLEATAEKALLLGAYQTDDKIWMSTYGATCKIGTEDAYPVSVVVGGNEKLRVQANGNTVISGNTTNVGTMTVTGAARFDGGITYIPQMGDISMGSFTNAP